MRTVALLAALALFSVAHAQLHVDTDVDDLAQVVSIPKRVPLLVRRGKTDADRVEEARKRLVLNKAVAEGEPMPFMATVPQPQRVRWWQRINPFYHYREYRIQCKLTLSRSEAYADLLVVQTDLRQAVLQVLRLASPARGQPQADPAYQTYTTEQILQALDAIKKRAALVRKQARSEEELTFFARRKIDSRAYMVQAGASSLSATLRGAVATRNAGKLLVTPKEWIPATKRGVVSAWQGAWTRAGQFKQWTLNRWRQMRGKPVVKSDTSDEAQLETVLEANGAGAKGNVIDQAQQLLAELQATQRKPVPEEVCMAPQGAQ